MKVKEASRLYHGTIMYVEEGPQKQKLEEYLWQKEFIKDQDKLKLLFHDPINDPDANIFGLSIELRKTNTLLELK